MFMETISLKCLKPLEIWIDDTHTFHQLLGHTQIRYEFPSYYITLSLKNSELPKYRGEDEYDAWMAMENIINNQTFKINLNSLILL